MTKITVEFDDATAGQEQGQILLHMEQLLRALMPDLDVRVYKARQSDDSPLRIQRTT